MKTLILLSVFFLSCSTSAFAGSTLTDVLSQRHFDQSPQQLEEKFGGEDKLVAELLELRKLETPPFVGVRAAKILMHYSSREDVARAMAEDIQNDELLGLTQLYAVNIDKVPNDQTRRRLAKALVDRSKNNAKVASAVESMQSSSDAEVSRMAKGL